MEMKETKEVTPHINLCVIGHVDHGKTTLTSVMTKVAKIMNNSNKAMEYGEIDLAPEERARGVTINATHVSIQAENKHISLIDCPGHQDYMKNMIVGAFSSLNGAILVVSAEKGVQTQTKEHLSIIGSISEGSDKMVPENLFVFLNHREKTDPADLELNHYEIKSILGSKYSKSEIFTASALEAGKVADEILILKEKISKLDSEVTKLEEQKRKGSSSSDVDAKLNQLKNSLNDDNERLNELFNSKHFSTIKNLFDAVDNLYIPLRDENKPFLMYIEGSVGITGIGTVVTGRVISGSVSSQNSVELFTLSENSVTKTVSIKKDGIEAFNKKKEVAFEGDDVGIALSGVNKDDVPRGSVIATPGTLKAHKTFVAEAYILSKEEGGRASHMRTGYSPQFYIFTADVTGKITVFDDGFIQPGKEVTFKVDLEKKLPIRIGDRFIIRESNMTVGGGRIKEIEN